MSTKPFDSEGYQILREFLSPSVLPAIRASLDRCINLGLSRADDQVPGTPAAYAYAATEELLRLFTPVLEEITGRQLFPTYSYFRIYKRGDCLPIHVDRPACEVSLSLCVDCKAPEPWPIFVESARGDAVPLELLPGDALLYKGCDCKHWREVFYGESAAQVFFHYVDQHGSNASWRNDKRLGRT